MNVPGRRAAPYSLRRRLTSAMGAGFFAIVTVLSLALWTYTRDSANRTYDLLLAGSAIAILERISPTPEGLIVDIPSSALEIVGLAETDRVFYRIFRQNGETLTGEPDLPLPGNHDIPVEPVFFDAAYSGETVRFVLQGKLVIGVSGPEWLLVQLGQTRIARDALQFDLFSKGLAGLVAIALIGLLFMRYSISRAMAPLAGIEADIRQRQPTDMTPLNALPPREVEGLIAAINDFMRRLETSKEHAQSFIADVAHQMRTSLAALQGQLQLATEQNDPQAMKLRLERAYDQSTRTIRMTNQLLSHAMVIHRGVDRPTEVVDMLPLIRSCVEEMLRDPATSDIEITVHRDGLDPSEAKITGDPVALREALRNLLDNAVRHGPPQNHIEIILETACREDRPVLCVSVEDAGPGIPVDQRAAVLERFFSLNRKGGGSGIGLSIVSAVAKSHGGDVTLTESRHGGLHVQMELPRKRSGK